MCSRGTPARPAGCPQRKPACPRGFSPRLSTSSCGLAQAASPRSGFPPRPCLSFRPYLKQARRFPYHSCASFPPDPLSSTIERHNPSFRIRLRIPMTYRGQKVFCPCLNTGSAARPVLCAVMIAPWPYPLHSHASGEPRGKGNRARSTPEAVLRFQQKGVIPRPVHWGGVSEEGVPGPRM